MTNEEHIMGLKGIKPFLQDQMRKINYEGMGEKDAQEIGETIDCAIEALKKAEKPNSDFILLDEINGKLIIRKSDIIKVHASLYPEEERKGGKSEIITANKTRIIVKQTVEEVYEMIKREGKRGAE